MAAVRDTEAHQVVEIVVQQSDAVAQTLDVQGGDAVQLGRDETRAADELQDLEASLTRGVPNNVSRVRIGVQRDVGNVTAGEVRRQLKDELRRRLRLVEQRLAASAVGDARHEELVERPRREHAHAAAPATREDAAVDGIGHIQQYAKWFEIVPAPRLFGSDRDREG